MTLSVVGVSGAAPYNTYHGNHQGAGGVIQIIASSGVISSGATMKLQRGNKTCTKAVEFEFPEDGFLLIKGIDNISAINTAFISDSCKASPNICPAPPYEVVLSGTTPGKLVTSM